ncbi:MAG: histidine phosphatase family protein [Sandaracinaceae bacterium]|nr:histidine phosphatase family protein [Sandaracinaceae bacterium]
MRRSYFFVRHGQAIYQQRGFDRSKYPRDIDWPLSSLGEAQAHQVAPRLLQLGVERVVSSKLARARSTAAAIAERGHLPYEHQWGALNEIHPTRLRVGKQTTEQDRWSWFDGWRAARAVRASVLTGVTPPGWDLRNPRERAFTVLSRLDAMPAHRIAVCGHGYWILLASLFVRGKPRTRWIANCSITRIDADGAGKYRLVSFATIPR